MFASNPLRLKSAFGALAVLALLASGVAQAHEDRIRIYQDVTEDQPITVFSGEARHVSDIDINWRGGNGRAVTGRVFADGQEIWSGMVPAYDPTFRASPNRLIRTLEIRVQGGSAYVNWAKVYGNAATASCGRRCDLRLIGSVTDAAELAMQVVEVIKDLQNSISLLDQNEHLIPLKIAAANVFSTSTGTGPMARADVNTAVVALELEFQRQEAYFRDLMYVNNDFTPIMTLNTLRARYRALFGSVQYPTR